MYDCREGVRFRDQWHCECSEIELEANELKVSSPGIISMNKLNTHWNLERILFVSSSDWLSAIWYPKV